MKSLLLLVVSMLLPGCAAAGGDIHSMVVGDKVLELVENRQLTFRADGPASGVWISPNGAIVACLFQKDSDEDDTLSAKLSVLPSTGGRAISLMSCAINPEVDVSPGYDQWMPDIVAFHQPEVVCWSPNSRLIAFPAIHITCSEENGEPIPSEEEFIVVMTGSGARKAAFALPDNNNVQGAICWSPDSDRVACVLSHWAKDKSTYNLCVFDITAGKTETVCTSERSIELRGWHNGGQSLLCCMQNPQKVWQECEVTVADRSVRTIMERQSRGYLSPNGENLLLQDEKSIRVENRITGKVLDIVESEPFSFINWSPDSRMFAYRRKIDIEDEDSENKDRLAMLWIACIEDHKMNHACVALDADSLIPSWSDDGRKIAYIHRERAYVAEMDFREADPHEKSVAGIPLSEEEEKDLILRNALQIGLAVRSYANDWDDKFPSAETFRQDMLPYLRDPGVMMRPGTEQYIVQYFPPPPIGQIEDTTSTILATLDAGFGWRAVLYVDGHVKIEQKK